jgi:hypothetical protein
VPVDAIDRGIDRASGNQLANGRSSGTSDHRLSIAAGLPAPRIRSSLATYASCRRLRQRQARASARTGAPRAGGWTGLRTRLPRCRIGAMRLLSHRSRSGHRRVRCRYAPRRDGSAGVLTRPARRRRQGRRRPSGSRRVLNHRVLLRRSAEVSASRHSGYWASAVLASSQAELADVRSGRQRWIRLCKPRCGQGEIGPLAGTGIAPGGGAYGFMPSQQSFDNRP